MGRSATPRSSWARVYGAQLEKGDDYAGLKPVIAIWILDGIVYRDSTWVHHRFRAVDERSGTLFSDHFEVHLLQLGRFEALAPLDDEDQWVYFLKEARNWTELPAELQTPALRMAMDQLKTISQSARDLERYRAREDYLRMQLTRENENKRLDQEAAEAREALEQTKQALSQTEQALSQTEQALSQTEQALSQTEQARLHAEQALSQTEQALSQTEQARLHAEQALSQTEQARLREEKARLQAERDRDLLREKLRAAGIDPDR